MSDIQDVVISFRLDEQVVRTLGRMPNRSEFIRQSVARALRKVCPICNGSGRVKKEDDDSRTNTAQPYGGDENR